MAGASGRTAPVALEVELAAMADADIPENEVASVLARTALMSLKHNDLGQAEAWDHEA